jgi:hypothetical protein
LIDGRSETAVRAVSELICGDHLQSRKFIPDAFIARSDLTPPDAEWTMALALAAGAAVQILGAPYLGVAPSIDLGTRLAGDLLHALPSPPPWAIDPLDRSDYLLPAEPYTGEERSLLVETLWRTAELTEIRAAEIEADPERVERKIRAGSPDLYPDFAYVLCLNFRKVATRQRPGAFEELLAHYVRDDDD